jgi:transcription termination factor Rho
LRSQFDGILVSAGQRALWKLKAGDLNAGGTRDSRQDAKPQVIQSVTTVNFGKSIIEIEKGLNFALKEGAYFDATL